jgi:hypothetical protein
MVVYSEINSWGKRYIILDGFCIFWFSNKSFGGATDNYCFRCGSVGALWKPSLALVWGISSAAFTPTLFQEVRTPMG